MPDKRRIRPIVAPLQRTLVRRVLQLLAGVMVLWFGLYLGLNDRRLGLLVSKVVTSSVRGQFRLGWAHYDYWSSLASLILNTPARVRGGDYTLLDPDGDLVLRVEEVEADLNIGELVRSLLRTAVSAPFKRGTFVDLHFTWGHVRGGQGRIHATASSLRKTPDRPEINIVAAMSGKNPNPDPKAPGRIRILIEGDGVTLDGLRLETGLGSWSARAEGLSGVATLRFSSASSETRPGKPAFVFALGPLRARRGELVLAPPPPDLPPGQPNPYAFPIEEVELRHFSARPSRPQELTLRGRARADEAPVELSGRLLDVFCDPGVDLQMSFHRAGALAAQATGGMLFGPARGRVRIYGPFSEQPPRTPTGAPHPCLAERATPYPLGSHGRALVIEGNVADLEARVAGIHATAAQSQLKLVHGVLVLPSVTAEALGGQVRMEPLRVSFGKPLQWSAQVRVQGTDPAQVELLPPSLRPLVGGRLTGGARVYGGGDPKRRGDRIRFANLDLVLTRERARDPWPRELTLQGDVTYGPDQVALRNIQLAGEGLRLTLVEGSVGTRSGRLDLDEVALEGGPQASHVLGRFGVPSALQSLAANLKVGGSLARPRIERGALAAHGLELAGQRLDELAATFTLEEGTLALQDVQLRGMGGSASGHGSLQLFRGTVRDLLADPPVQLRAKVRDLRTAELLHLPVVQGQLSGQVELEGTLARPVGTASVTIPTLAVLEAPLRDVIMDLELRPGWILLNSLYAALGPGDGGRLNGSAQVGREGSMPIRVGLRPHQLRLRDLPGAQFLPYLVDGLLTGALQVTGTGRPLRPVLEGELVLNDLLVRGRAPLGGDDPQVIFRLLTMAVRELKLGRAALRFEPRGDATRIVGTLFDTFRVDGTVYLDPQDPRGQLVLRFGCTEEPGRPASAGGARDCDVAVERLLPDMQQLGDVGLKISGALEVRFGRSLPTGPAGSLGLHAGLRLSRALVTVKTVDDEGGEQWYRVFNDGDVVVSTDGQTYRFEQAHFLSERTRGAGGAVESKGEVDVLGHVGRTGSDLVLRGQLGLELLEQLVRSTFRRVRGTAVVDLRLRGPLDRPELLGSAELRGAQLTPHDVDTPFDVPSGRLVLSPGRAELQDLQVRVDGATMRAGGSLDLLSLAPLRTGRIDLRLDGAVAGRLLQWYFPRNLSDARGRIGLRDLRLHGTLEAPRLQGELQLAGLFLNVRRFHELQLLSGTVRFLPAAQGAAGTILLGCGPERRPARGGCQAVEALVDSDGRIALSGEIAHTGLAGFSRPPWHQPLAHVDVDVRLGNVRHSTPGVYNVELTTATPLRLLGDRDQLTLSGKIDIVSGRYVQPFDLTERFLARRVVEEEEPFWRDDPFLSSHFELDLSIITRGNLQVLNNVADLRLSSTDFSLSGPLRALRMGGVVRVDGGRFMVPGLRGEFTVKGDSKLEFSKAMAWPETPWVELRGSNVQFDRAEEQRNIELALRGKVSELKIECISSDGLNASDCASYLLLGGTAADVRRALGGDPASSSSRTLAYSDNAAKLLSQQLLTRQLSDPLREKLRLDVVSIQFGVSTFDVQLCKRFGLYLRACGLAEWGLLAATAARYRAYGELQLSDYAVGQVSFDRLERGFDLLQDTINRFKLQFGLRLPLRF